MTRTKEYLYSIGDEINGLRIVKQIRHGKRQLKGYLVESIYYPDAPKYDVYEYSLKAGKGDAYLAGLRIFEGNSLWSKKEFRKYIIDIEQAKTIPPTYEKPILLQCPDCKEKKSMTPHNLRYGFSCKACSKGTSYPELLFMSYLENKGLKYDYQVKFDNSRRRIDFYIYGLDIYVETHGIAHYEPTQSWYERTKNSDNIKRAWCKENNKVLIELDCRESDFNFIKNSINSNDKFPQITEKDEKDILKIMSKNKRYPTKEICDLYRSGYTTRQISTKFQVSFQTINRILKKNNVEIRSGGKKRIKLPEQEIINKYVDEEYTITELSTEFNVCRSTVYSLLKRNNIETRSQGYRRAPQVSNLEGGENN